MCFLCQAYVWCWACVCGHLEGIVVGCWYQTWTLHLPGQCSTIELHTQPCPGDFDEQTAPISPDFLVNSVLLSSLFFSHVLNKCRLYVAFANWMAVAFIPRISLTFCLFNSPWSRRRELLMPVGIQAFVYSFGVWNSVSIHHILYFFLLWSVQIHKSQVSDKHKYLCHGNDSLSFQLPGFLSVLQKIRSLLWSELSPVFIGMQLIMFFNVKM